MFVVLSLSCAVTIWLAHIKAVPLQVISSMEELYKFMNQSNATLDLKVGSELITEAPEEGAEPLEVHISCHTEAAVTQCASSKLYSSTTRGSEGLPSHLHAVTLSDK